MRSDKDSEQGSGDDSEQWRCNQCGKVTPFKDNNLLYVGHYSFHDAGLFQCLKLLLCDSCDPRPKPINPTGKAA